MSSFRLEELAAIESVAMPPRKRRAQKSEVRKVEVTGHVGGRSQPEIQGVLGRGVPVWSPFLSTVSTFGSTSVEEVCALSGGVTAEPRNHTPV